MRIVIADLHLTDRYDSRLGEFLSGLTAEADELIINGDLWDEDITEFAGFERAWRPLLQKWAALRTVYLPGNHDTDPLLAEKAWFAAEVLPVYSFTDGSVRFHIEHGHVFDTEGLVRRLVPQPLLGLIAHANRVRTWLWSRLFPFTHSFSETETVQQHSARKLIDADVVIFSHSHKPLADRSSGLYNTGAIMHGQASWLVIDQGAVALRKSTY
ncbi:MAG: Calcineurin-like phosphoesterase superfamily domain protein [candidate division WS6 bacterium OLB20]|uniref:Calcineurin-like phosphoesterase superfamily domain protein n=1 Tax=candidate division WS6 bacterium OLB20 TaxID=1617426 RepID=A0A136M087_9BACT|nr:MAG: Calcineurin-like phosphoesterase superfamily domain protein [candidate division WS6 bacterium OLB20]